MGLGPPFRKGSRVLLRSLIYSVPAPFYKAEGYAPCQHHAELEESEKGVVRRTVWALLGLLLSAYGVYEVKGCLIWLSWLLRTAGLATAVPV